MAMGVSRDFPQPDLSTVANSAIRLLTCSGRIKFKRYAKQPLWRVTDDLAAIFFFGCDFDGEVLVRGRFYCQTDMLERSHIVPKSSEFVRWADEVVRFVEAEPPQSSGLDAYVGLEAEEWRHNGGRFASSALLGHGIVSAPQRNNAEGS